MDSCVDNAAAITTAISAVLFLVSEILPFTTKVKGNGIVQIISDVLVAYIKKTNEVETALPEEV